MRFIGDVHGKMGSYLAITDGCVSSIQVGDFGIGFVPIPELSSAHRFIRGNHDNPQLARNHPNWIADGHRENGMFFIGGGYSIDRAYRTEGLDWWADEELSTVELYDMVDRYAKAKPDVLVCHECPARIAKILFGDTMIKSISPSRTSQALEAMIDEHKPDIVIHGHWHIARDVTLEGVRYVSLPELGFIDL